MRTWAGEIRKKYPAAAITTTPTRPRTTLGSFGPSMKPWSCGGRAMALDLELARDFERHEARGLVDGLPGDDDVDLLELPGRFQVRHEVGDRGRREGGAAQLQQGLLLLEAGDPQVAGHGVDEDVQQRDRLALALGQLLEDAHAALDLGQLVLDVGALPQRRLERGRLAGEAVDLAREPALLGRQAVPEEPQPADRRDVDDGEQDAEVERGQREVERRACLPGLGRSQVDPDHFGCSLSLGRRSANPTATASAGASALTSSA